MKTFDTNKVRNSSRVLYEYEYQAEDDFPGSVYEEGLVEKYKDNPVLLCNLIPIFTKNVCSINNNPIIKYKYPISIMKLPNGNVLSVFNDGRMYEKNKTQDRMWNGPLKNSLPNKKIPMLPNILSDNICSLVENEKRFVLALDIHINDENTLTEINYKVCSIIVNKNYAYEDRKMLNKNTYKKILDISKKLNVERNYKCDIIDSHDVVEFYMIFMILNLG